MGTGESPPRFYPSRYLGVLLLSSTFKYHEGMSDNKLVISDEAVEAAYAQLTSSHIEIAGMLTSRSMRAALEAAAPYLLAPPRRRDPGLIPYLMAKAWDEGYSNGRAPRHVRVDNPNPYRSQA